MSTPVYEDEILLKQDAEQWSFRDDTLMEGPPECTLEGLHCPKLRKCPFDLNTIIWRRQLGGGLDGFCWEVKFGDKGPFVLKLFWDRKHDPRFGGFAAQVECRNVALLQIMEASIQKGEEENQPVLLNARPKTWLDATENIQSFSDILRSEGKNMKTEAASIGIELKPILSVPRLRKSYGWLFVGSQVLKSLPTFAQPDVVCIGRSIRRCLEYDADEDYMAIVYEYIEPGNNDPVVIQKAIDFFTITGFCFVSNLEKNWQSGVLLDYSDIANPYEKSWYGGCYKEPIKAAAILDPFGRTA